MQPPPGGDDCWSLFGGVCSHLPYDDVCSLRRVCRALDRAIGGECATCTRVDRTFSSTDVERVLRAFPALRSFRGIAFTSPMRARTAARMLERWPAWAWWHLPIDLLGECATRAILGRTKRLSALSLHASRSLGATCARRLPLVPALRRSRRTLVDLRLELPRLPPQCAAALCHARQLRTLHVAAVLSESEMVAIARALPSSVVTLRVTNQRAHHDAPRFLEHLQARRDLRDIALHNCVVPSTAHSSQWQRVAQFCARTHARRLVTDVLRADCVRALMARGVPFVTAHFLGTLADFPTLVDEMPRAYCALSVRACA